MPFWLSLLQLLLLHVSDTVFQLHTNLLESPSAHDPVPCTSQLYLLKNKLTTYELILRKRKRAKVRGRDSGKRLTDRRSKAGGLCRLRFTTRKRNLMRSLSE